MQEKQKEEHVTLQTVLSFVTATDRIPAAGSGGSTGGPGGLCPPKTF